MQDLITKIQFLTSLHPLVRNAQASLGDLGEVIIRVTPNLGILEEALNVKWFTRSGCVPIAYLSLGEPEYFYDDIFINNDFSHGFLSLAENDIIFDVGANVGYYSIYVSQQLSQYKIYAFEPSPIIFDILNVNALKHKLNIQLFNWGIGEHCGTADFTCYPNSSGFSTYFPNQDEEREQFKKVVTGQPGQDEELQIYLQDNFDSIFDFRFQTQKYRTKIMNLSSFIDEHKIPQIDLLKLDVEKSELEVIRGIRPHHWSMIKQVLVEVHDRGDAMNTIQNELTSNGFELIIKDNGTVSDSQVKTIFGRNKNFQTTREALPDRTKSYSATFSEDCLPEKLIRQHLAHHLMNDLPLIKIEFIAQYVS